MNGAESQFFYPGGTDASVLSTVTEPLRKYANLTTFIKNLRIDGSDNHCFSLTPSIRAGRVSLPNPDIRLPLARFTT